MPEYSPSPPPPKKKWLKNLKLWLNIFEEPFPVLKSCRRSQRTSKEAKKIIFECFKCKQVRENVIGSTRTLNRRRHSIGSWFRSSLAAVRKNASTASGLEAAGSGGAVERPSTSSERALLARAVSSSVNCVSYRYLLRSLTALELHWNSSSQWHWNCNWFRFKFCLRIL